MKEPYQTLLMSSDMVLFIIQMCNLVSVCALPYRATSPLSCLASKPSTSDTFTML